MYNFLAVCRDVLLHCVISMNDGPELSGTITALLLKVRGGDKSAEHELLTIVYDDLRRIAMRQLADFRGHSLDATGLVHEVCGRMLNRARLEATDRRHFYALISRAMRDVLIDHIRADQTIKRGGGLQRQPMIECSAGGETLRFDILDLNDALAELGRLDPDAARVVHLRFYGGCTLEESAELIGCSFATIRRHWDYARAWLHERLSQRDSTQRGKIE